MHELAAKVARSIPTREIKRLGVAVSGGADSVALLLLLAETDLSLAIVHLNHGLRGEESEGDEAFCGDLAVRLGLPFLCRRVDTKAAGGNLEEAARDARRRFFFDLIKAGEVDMVATAHTRNDQAETVLFRLLRGAHLSGLAGIDPISQGRILRPLLDVDRQQLVDYLHERGQAWREDSSNTSTEFARNRIRHELLPQLTRDWNPELTKALAQTARLARDEEIYWAGVVKRIAEESFVLDGNSIVFPASILVTHRVATGRRLVRHALDTVRGGLKGIEFQHIEAVLNLTAGQHGHGRVILPGLDVMRSFEWIRLSVYEPGIDRLAERNVQWTLTVPGEVEAPDRKRTVRVDLVGNWRYGEGDTVEADLDWDLLRAVMPSDSLLLRSWKPGDQYMPAGSTGSKKVKELFQDRRIPIWERATWPIITAGTAIIWARAFGPASALVAGPATKRAVRFSLVDATGSESKPGSAAS